MKPVVMLMKLLTDRMPRKVAISAITMSVTLVVFAVLFFVLGGAHDDAIEQNGSLKNELTQTTTKAKQTRDDRQFILDNRDAYEALLNGERLVPHTPRVALEQLTALQKQNGLTSLAYSFTSAANQPGAAAPTVTGGYKLQVQKVDLKIGASMDTQVYDFLLDLGQKFPGSAVVEQFSLERAREITSEALNQVSRNHDSGLVKGEIHFSWRTAQAQEDANKANAPAKGAK